MEFKIVKKGYDIKSVDYYIRKLTSDYEDRLSLQKDRIFALKDELEKAGSQDDSEDDMLLTLYEAVKRAETIESRSRNLFELEAKRLSLTYMKMESILCKNDDVQSLKPQLLSMIKDCRTSLEQNVLAQRQSLSQSDIEEPTLIDAKEGDVTEEVVLHVKKPPHDILLNETGFDLKEAVNPTEDLDEIMKAFDFYNDRTGDKH